MIKKFQVDIIGRPEGNDEAAVTSCMKKTRSEIPGLPSDSFQKCLEQSYEELFPHILDLIDIEC